MHPVFQMKRRSEHEVVTDIIQTIEEARGNTTASAVTLLNDVTVIARPPVEEQQEVAFAPEGLQQKAKVPSLKLAIVLIALICAGALVLYLNVP